MGLLTILYAIICFCILIMVHEVGHFVAAKLTGVQVNELSLGMGPLVLKHQGKETMYSIRLLPIGGFCSMEGEDEESDNVRAFNNKSSLQKAFIVVAGALMNLLLTIVILSCIAGYVGVGTTTIDTVSPEGTAYAAGLREGDKIIEMERNKVCFFSDVRSLIQQSDGEVDLVLLRGDRKVYTTVPVEKNEQGIPVIGITAEVSKNPVTAVHCGLRSTVRMGQQMLKYFGNLFTGKSSVKDLTGPVGIVSAIGVQAQRGFLYVANLMALINLNLAIINMLPLPALDGGRFLIILINAVMGKAISEELEGKIHFAGMMLLFCLAAYVLVLDVGRLM